MNKYTVTTKPTKGISIKGAYEIEKDGKKTGDIAIITKAGIYKEMPTDDYVQNMHDTKGRPVAVMTFNFRSEYHARTNTYTNTTLNYIEGKDDGFIKWWTGYLLAEVDGNANGDGCVVQVTNVSKVLNTKSARFRDRLKVSNIIEKISEGKKAHKELSNIMYMYGHSPIDKSIDQIMLELINPETDALGNPLGILLNEENIELFNKTFVEGANATKDITIAVNKSKALKIIVQRNVGTSGAAWYWNDNLVGTYDAAIYDYFRKNDPMFKSLCSELDRKETVMTDEDDETSDKPLTKSEMLGVLRKADKEKYPELAKGLNLMSEAKIKEYYDLITKPIEETV